MPAGEDLALLLRRLREFDEGSPEREAYLEDLAAQIRKGTYRVDTEELARKLLDELLRESGPSSGAETE
jgi:anti-sigma28 factor (negative regulator of flagellin synthesis)